MKITPYTIQYIMEQLRHGMVGALVYVGGHDLFFNHPARGRDTECRPSFRSHLDSSGVLKYEVGLSFRVKGRTDENWSMVVAYEPDDTYTVWLLRACLPRHRLQTGQLAEVVNSLDNVKDDDLQHAVESVYDGAMGTLSEELIPIPAASMLRPQIFNFKRQ